MRLPLYLVALRAADRRAQLEMEAAEAKVQVAAQVTAQVDAQMTGTWNRNYTWHGE